MLIPIRILGRGGGAQETINTVSFEKQQNQVKQYHCEYIDKNIIQSLKKLNVSYTPACLY